MPLLSCQVSQVTFTIAHILQAKKQGIILD